MASPRLHMDTEGTLWLIDQLQGFEARYALDHIKGALKVTEIRLISSVRGGLTTTALRSVKVSEAIRKALAQMREEPGKWDEAFELVSFKGVEKHVLTEPLRPGKRGRSDLFLAANAMLVVQQAEVSNSPITDVAKDRIKVAPATLESRLALARERGLLTKPPKNIGKFSGALTPKALALLQLDQNIEPKGATRAAKGSKRSPKRKGQ